MLSSRDAAVSVQAPINPDCKHFDIARGKTALATQDKGETELFAIHYNVQHIDYHPGQAMMDYLVTKTISISSK